MIRLRRSRPMLSVPRGKRAEGGLSSLPGNCWMGLWGATSGAKKASRIAKRKMVLSED
jgi:hypothetical protein